MPSREDLGENESRSDLVTGAYSKAAGLVVFAFLSDRRLDCLQSSTYVGLAP